MSREDAAEDASVASARATSWLDGLGTRLRETASVVTEKLDAMDDQLDSFARRARAVAMGRGRRREICLI
jgi:hypothetical protein